SEYFQRQMWATYIDDFVGVASRHFIGVDKMMWSSDYPHQASTWPHSQEVVARDFKDASAEDKFKITRGNAARLYGFDACSNSRPLAAVRSAVRGELRGGLRLVAAARTREVLSFRSLSCGAA